MVRKMDYRSLAAVPHGTVDNAGVSQVLYTRPLMDMAAKNHQRFFAVNKIQQVFTAGVKLSQNFIQDAPEELNLIFAMALSPPAPFVPTEPAEASIPHVQHARPGQPRVPLSLQLNGRVRVSSGAGKYDEQHANGNWWLTNTGRAGAVDCLRPGLVGARGLARGR